MEQEVHEQVKDNSPSIERILRPLTYTSWLLGVGIAHPRKCPKAITIIIRIIHMAVLFYVLRCEAQDRFGSNIIDLSKVIYFAYLDLLNKTMCYISAFYYIYHGIRQYNKWPELMDRLKELDQKIRKEISMNDRSIKIVEALAVFMTFIFCPLWPTIIPLFDYFSPYSLRISSIREIMFYYILSQLLISTFIFDVVVYVLYRRFQTLNNLIEQLDQLSDVQWIAFKIRRIRELHADICDLANMVNNIHDLHLLFCSGNCFTMAIASLFYFVQIMNYGLHWFYPMLDFLDIVYSMHFWLICWICTLACEESNQTGRIIHKIILNYQPMNLDNNETSNQSNLEIRFALEDSYSEQNFNCSNSHNPYVVEKFLRRNLELDCVTKEINDFSIQLQQNRVTFTACDFFEINNSLYGWFVGVIITYVIIMLQLFPV